MILTVWSYIFPVLIAVTIALNRWTKWPHGWLLGALAQAGQMTISILYDSVVPGFILSFLPLAFFVFAWVTALDARRGQHRKEY